MVTRVDLVTQLDKLVKASETAERYISHVGMNYTFKGLPHPQELLLRQLEQAILDSKNLIAEATLEL